MKKKLFALMILVLAFSGCHQIHSGEIVDKIYTPSSTHGYMTMSRIGNSSYPQWNTVYISENFVLKVRGFNGKETVIETFQVNQDNFYCYQIGETFIDSIPCNNSKW